MTPNFIRVCLLLIDISCCRFSMYGDFDMWIASSPTRANGPWPGEALFEKFDRGESKKDETSRRHRLI